MNIARSITNHYPDFRLLELSKTTPHPETRGPYMVVQDGADPQDPTSRECTFVLTRRGTWLHFYVFLMLPVDIRQGVGVFQNIPEVMGLVETLTGKPRVESLATLPELLKGNGFAPLPDDPISRILLDEVARKHGPIRLDDDTFHSATP